MTRPLPQEWINLLKQQSATITPEILQSFQIKYNVALNFITNQNFQTYEQLQHATRILAFLDLDFPEGNMFYTNWNLQNFAIQPATLFIDIMKDTLLPDEGNPIIETIEDYSNQHNLNLLI